VYFSPSLLEPQKYHFLQYAVLTWKLSAYGADRLTFSLPETQNLLGLSYVTSFINAATVIGTKLRAITYQIYYVITDE